jgi:hypothetical protein
VSAGALRLRVETTSTPEPHLLRSAIAARLAGRAFPSRAEDEVAVRVAAAVSEQMPSESARWR